MAVAKWLGAPLGGGTTSTTRAKDSDRQDTKSAPKFGGWAILTATFVVSVLLGVGTGWGLYGNAGFVVGVCLQ
jgi:hypothetical protein